MTDKIKAWTTFGPRLEPTDPMGQDEIIENIVAATNQSRGSVLAVLSELDVQLERVIDPPITLETLRKHARGALSEMLILRRGNRLSVTPVSEGSCA